MSDDGGSHDDHDDYEENVALKPASNAHIVELARECCTAEQWGEWLSVPLEHAAAGGVYELVEELVLAGAIGDPISAAMKSGQYDLVNRLLQLDHEAAIPQDHHLELAVDPLEDETFLNLLLSTGLKPDKDNELSLAVTLGNMALVSILLKNGAKPDDSPDDFQWDEDYCTPLLLAAKAGDDEMVRLLLDAGASAGRRLSVEKPRVEEPGSEDGHFTDVETMKTESALDLAAIGGHVDTINAIIEHDPLSINSVTESTGNTALLYAVKHDQLGALTALAEAGADLEVRDEDGNTALHIAIISPLCDTILPELLRFGAKVNPTNWDGLTPLCLAVEEGHGAATHLLVSSGADVNVSLLNVSTLDDAMMRTLLGYGADVNTKRAKDGNTPLHLAAQDALSENVEFLLEAGGDETAVNSAGKTPADVTGQGHVADYILCFSRGACLVRAQLRKALRRRTLRLRVFLVLCRKFPKRVRLHTSPRGNADDGRGSTASTYYHNRAMKKALKADEAGDENQLESTTTDGARIPALDEVKTSCSFTAGMDRLLSLQADEVFQKIVGFL